MLTMLTRQAWQIVSYGPGSKGERRYAWAHEQIARHGLSNGHGCPRI
jgi:hypothetical protein